MGKRTGETNKYKELLQKIADHGTEVVEVLSPEWSVKGEAIRKERILIILEMLFHKASQEGKEGAAQQYLDRLLGKPKESLNLSGGENILSGYSDEELTDKITSIIKAARKGGAGEAD